MAVTAHVQVWPAACRRQRRMGPVHAVRQAKSLKKAAEGSPPLAVHQASLALWRSTGHRGAICMCNCRAVGTAAEHGPRFQH